MFAATGSTITAAISGPLRANAVVERGVVVVRHDDGVGDGALGDAGRAREPERGDAAARGDEQRVDVAVVAAGELHDLRPAGHAPRRGAPPSSPASVPDETSRTFSTDGTRARSPRRARPRGGSARRRTSPPPRRVAPPRRPSGARDRGSTRPTTARSRGSACRRCRRGRHPRRARRRTARRRPTRTSGPASRRRRGSRASARSKRELTIGVRRFRVRGT